MSRSQDLDPLGSDLTQSFCSESLTIFTKSLGCSYYFFLSVDEEMGSKDDPTCPSDTSRKSSEPKLECMTPKFFCLPGRSRGRAWGQQQVRKLLHGSLYPLPGLCLPVFHPLQPSHLDTFQESSHCFSSSVAPSMNRGWVVLERL